MKIDLAGRKALLVAPDGALRPAIAAALAASGASVREAAPEAAAALAGTLQPWLLVHVSAGAESGPVEPPPALPDAGAFAALVRAAAPAAGRVVSLVSVAGLVPVRRAPVFSAGEAALVSLTRSLAMELGGAGVVVNGLAVASFADGAAAVAEGLLTHAAVKRPAKLDEVVAALLFLADPANTYTTGHVLAVDGGWAAGYARDF